MIIFVEERGFVIDGYVSRFGREGIKTTGFKPDEFCEWLDDVSADDVRAVEAFLIGNCSSIEQLSSRIKNRCDAPVIALKEHPSLEATLKLFQIGIDDVVKKPVHVREILARINAIRRRGSVGQIERRENARLGSIKVYSDGRDPQINNIDFPLPRRERRILEYLVNQRGRRVTKTQIFNTIYGIYDAEIDENVVESHISKLRKKLKTTLGYDPIDSKRFLGYSINL